MKKNRIVEKLFFITITLLAIVILIQFIFFHFYIESLPMHSVEEMKKIMHTYFIFMLIIVSIVSILRAYFYSKLIVIPILHLDEITKSMVKLDFSKKCNINTPDEIGNLANNINILSAKLESTLYEVKEANKKLKDDIIEKERIENLRKQFVVNISHELKTPLTIIKGISNGFLVNIYDRNNDENFQKILTEVDDMDKLIHSLIEIFRIESGEIPLNKEIFQLSDVIFNVHHKLKTLTKNKKIKVHLETTDDFAFADENQIEIVFKNIYYNAIKYTPSNGHITISMNVYNQKCICIVENSDIQIPKEDLEKIWEPFYRVEKSRNRALGGYGLGLYIVKTILDKHKSEYGFENTKYGVKVYFSLPLVDYENEWN